MVVEGPHAPLATRITAAHALPAGPPARLTSRNRPRDHAGGQSHRRSALSFDVMQSASCGTGRRLRGHSRLLTTSCG